MKEASARQVRRVLPILIAATVLGGLLGTPAAAQGEWEWRDVQQHVRILPDGDVVVFDTRTLRTTADFGEAFLCVLLAEGQSLTMLPATGPVSPGPAAFGLTQPCDGGTEVVVRQDERVSERRVRFAYRLHGALDSFSDVVQWWWTILEDDRPDVRGYVLLVEAPGPMDAPFEAFIEARGTRGAPAVWRSPDRRTLLARLDAAPAGGTVEVRFLMDPRLFTLTGGDPGLEQLLTDRERLRPAR